VRLDERAVLRILHKFVQFGFGVAFRAADGDELLNALGFAGLSVADVLEFKRQPPGLRAALLDAAAHGSETEGALGDWARSLRSETQS